MIKKIINRLFILSLILLYVSIMCLTYSYGKMFNDYSAFIIWMIASVLYIVFFYIEGVFDNFIKDRLKPKLQNLLKWFNRRNLI